MRSTRVCLALALLLPAACVRAGEPYRPLPRVAAGVFSCAGDTASHLVASRTELDEALARLRPRCGPEGFDGARADLLRTLEEAGFRWEREAFVVVQDWYGTGMARASLDLASPAPDTVKATIRWKVPPPPVTPDATRCLFAFAVDKARVVRVLVTGRDPSPIVLPVPRTSLR